MDKTLKARDGSTYTAIYDRATKTYTIPDYPVFADGTWHEQDYDAERVNRIVSFTNAAYKFIAPKLGIGHPQHGENETTLPAFGRFGQLVRKGARIVADLFRVPAEVVDGMVRGNWGPVSVEMRKFRHPQTGEIGEVIDRVKFLGLVPPEVATIAASTEFAADEEPTVLDWEHYKPFSADPPTEAVADTDAAPKSDAGTESVPPLAESADAKVQEEMPVSEEPKAREDNALAEKYAALEKQNKELQDRLEAEEKRKVAEFAARVNDGWMSVVGKTATPAEEESFRKAAEEIGPDKPKVFSIFMDAWQTKPAVGKPTEPKGAHVEEAKKDERRSDAKLFAAVQAVMKERNIADPAVAAAIVEKEMPELVEEERKTFTGQAGLSERAVVHRYNL